jgi:hypothetical protein
MDADKPVGCVRCAGFCARDMRYLQVAYGCTDVLVREAIICGIKYQAGHWSSPVNELLHLRST